MDICNHEVIGVDLSQCKAGDQLLSKHGMILTYVRPLDPDNYYDHEVRYPNGSSGTRTNDGFVFRHNRLPDDHDIVDIIKEEG